MKKKNIIKKLLSVALSAATVFSLFTLPAHAIVPGEGAYTGQEDGYICVNADDYTTQFIPKEDIPHFSYGSTYDALSPEEKAQIDSIQENGNSKW